MGVAHVLQAGTIGMVAIVDARGNHLAIIGIGEEQELLELVAGDIAENAAIAIAGEKPVRTIVEAQRVRAETHGVDHLANGALGNEIARFDGGRHFKMLGIEH
ncbi:hypothetical protein D9M68_949240 [compost metagenome]